MPEADVIPYKEDDLNTVGAHVDKYLEASCMPMHTDPTKIWKDNHKNFSTFQL